LSSPADAVQIPGYTILRPLGIGGMASVYLALQESLEREVALKVMAPALAANQEFTSRFLKEGRITAKLSHPNLVTVFDIGQHGTTYYLAAEYIPGGTLREKMAAGMSIGEMLDVIRDVAAGLHYAHEKGFVHRDVKPGNILFKTNGTAVLADFGIAKSMDQSASSRTMATQVGNSIGTPHYMSPEQARAEKVDGRSDLYALGAVLFEMLTNEPPYDASDPFTIALMHVTHPVPKLPAQVAWLQPLIDRLMAKSPDDRYPTGEAFIADLEKLLATAPEAQSLRSGTETRKRAAPRFSATQGALAAKAAAAGPAGDAVAGTPRRGVPKPVLLGAVAAGVVVLAVGAWFALRSAAPPSVPPTVPITEVPARRVDTPVQPVATAPVDTSPEPVDVPITSDDVAGLLAKAREYVKLGFMENGRRLVSPEGDSAVDLYRQVLAIDPTNADALAGLGQIADYYESKAKATFDRGFYTGSMVLAEQGLRADPDSESLKKLLEESKQAAGL
jgi:hypothetical protein